MWVSIGFLAACGWGWICYRVGKRAAENAALRAREKEYEQVEQIFERTADWQRGELLEQLRGKRTK